MEKYWPTLDHLFLQVINFIYKNKLTRSIFMKYNHNLWFFNPYRLPTVDPINLGLSDINTFMQMRYQQLQLFCFMTIYK